MLREFDVDLRFVIWTGRLRCFSISFVSRDSCVGDALILFPLLKCLLLERELIQSDVIDRVGRESCNRIFIREKKTSFIM